MYRVCCLILLGLVTVVYANNYQKRYRIENNTSFTISKIRLFEQNLTKAIAPYSYINGEAQFESGQGSVLMFFADGLNYGVYIENPENNKPLLIQIDSINSKTRTVLISQ